MPNLYCRPINNLANRMMSIVSASRLAKLWGYDFKLIWDWGPETLFSNSFDELFNNKINSTNVFSLDAHILYMPQKNINGRQFYSKPNSEIDVFLDGWAHLTLNDSDLIKSPGDITSELRNELLNIFTPSNKVILCCNNLGYHDQSFDLGIHIRRGSSEFDSISDNNKILNYAINIINKKKLNSFFISSSDHNCADFFGYELSKFGSCFVSRSYNNEPSFRNHAMAIYDLIFFSRCNDIIKTGATTYSSLAAILGQSILHTFTENGECFEHPALYSVGAGL